MEVVNDQLTQHERTGVATDKAGELKSDEFMKFVEETRAQPAFRQSMDTAADYYDGNQLTAQILADLDNMGFSSLMANLIKPAIDTVLGIEAKTRSDFRMVSDDDAHQEVAEALSQKLKETERETRADRACSDAYASQVKAGLGWVHVSRNGDPFKYPHRVESVHRREMSWDWAARDPALDDARYVIRSKWYDTTQVVAALPEHGDLINAAAGGWQPDWLQRATENAVLMNAFNQESRMSVSAWDWRNIDNRRVALQECWYAVYVRGLVLRLEDTVVEFNKKNPLHIAAIGSGKFRPEPAVYRKLRVSLWFGPHKLQDLDPGQARLPYVPFWGFREDLTGVPYGLIRNMIPLQDEVNARRRKLMWLLSSKRVQIDSDALDQRYSKLEDMVDEVSRPDSVLITNPARTNKQTAIKIESDLGLAQQQFEILQEAKEGIQAAAGIFNSIMGKSDGAKSGIAVNSLVEQSSNTLGELNDNFRFGRALVGELLVSALRVDMKGKQVKVMTGPQESRRKSIFLNKPVTDELTGITMLENNTDTAKVKVALEEVPSTPAYRAQQLMMMGETLKSLPPELQAPLMPFLIDGTDLPKRHEMSAILRKSLGQADENGEPVDPKVAQLTQQLEQLHQQSQEMAGHYEQAIQEQSQKAGQLEVEVNSLKLQVANKAGEIAVRNAEIELKRAESAAAAQERTQGAELKQSELGIREKEISLKGTELAIKAAKESADHDHRATEFEHNQLAAAGSAVPSAEAPKMTPEQQIAHEQELARIRVNGAVEQAVKVAQINKEAKVEAAELQASATPSELTPEQDAAAEDEVREPAAAAKPKADAKPAKPKKRSLEFTYEGGKLTGATRDGKPLASITRHPDGSMKGADLYDHGDRA